MQGIAKILKNYWFLWLTIIVGIIAGILYLATPASAELITRYLITALCVIIVIDKLAEMIQTIRSGSYGIDILAISAIIACLLTGEFWAAYMIALMLSSGEALEEYADKRAKRELSALLARRPLTAHIVKNGKVIDKPVQDIKLNDILLIKTNEVVPVDGTLISNGALMNESSITGEAVPYEKTKGQNIISGTINSSDAIKIKATSTIESSYYSQIIKLVKESESAPAHFVNMANRYAVPFTLISYVIAGIAWFVSGDPKRFAEVLVVASPCPLLLAAPIAFVSGMSRSSRHGIIVKNGTVLEQIAKANTYAFDKTGTLTSGNIIVDQIKSTKEFTAEQVLTTIAAAEAASTHILAGAITQCANKKHLTIKPAKAIREVTGGGIFATFDGNIRATVGSRAFLENNKITGLPVDDFASTSVLLAINGEYKGAVLFRDQIRPKAAVTVDRLRGSGVTHIDMLTGDKKVVAESIAKQVNIDHIHAELKPTGKVRVIDALKQESTAVVMVGDGINDAPVLARADVGIAMGAKGSTAASESADAVITVDDITKIADLRDIALRTIRIAKQSILVGIALCLVLEVIATFGVIPALLGAVLQEVIDVVVIINALRAHRG